MEAKEKVKNQAKPKEIEKVLDDDDKPEYQEKIVFLWKPRKKLKTKPSQKKLKKY